MAKDGICGGGGGPMPVSRRRMKGLTEKEGICGGGLPSRRQFLEASGGRTQEERRTAMCCGWRTEFREVSG